MASMKSMPSTASILRPGRPREEQAAFHVRTGVDVVPGLQ